MRVRSARCVGGNFSPSIKQTVRNMNEEFVDNTIANLKIIGMIQRNQKLCIRKGQLTVDRSDRFQSLIRWLRNDSRDVILLHVRNTVNNAVRIARALIDASSTAAAAVTPQHRSWTLSRIMQEIEATRHGLINLKTTYADDSIMIASLDVLVDRLLVNRDEIAAALATTEPDASTLGPAVDDVIIGA